MDPQEIEHIEFKTTRLKEGYDPDQVDTFLDRVANELRELQQQLLDRDTELTKLKRANAEQQRMLDEYGNFQQTQVLPAVRAEDTPAPVTATLILNAAQETADKVIAQAQQKAAEITASADQNARDRSDEIVAGAIKRRDDIQAKCSDMEARLAEHTSRVAALKTHLSGMLSNLEQAP